MGPARCLGCARLGATMTPGREIVLAVALLICLVTDLRSKLIYNWVTVPAMVLGLTLSAWEGGWAGLGDAAIGLLVCGGVMLLPFLAGGMGGGDVKLLAAVGALGGAGFGLRTTVYACAVGAAISLALMVRHGRLLRGLKGTWMFLRTMFDRNLAVTRPEKLGLPTLPFATCVAVGAVWARWFDILQRH